MEKLKNILGWVLFGYSLNGENVLKLLSYGQFYDGMNVIENEVWRTCTISL